MEDFSYMAIDPTDGVPLYISPETDDRKDINEIAGITGKGIRSLQVIDPSGDE